MPAEMRRLARHLLTMAINRNRRYYAVGTCGIVVGLGLMVAAVFTSRSGPKSAQRLPNVGIAMILAGQVVATISGVVAGVPVMRRRKKAANVQAGLCPNCGYDLRASPERCSECGTAAPALS